MLSLTCPNCGSILYGEFDAKFTFTPTLALVNNKLTVRVGVIHSIEDSNTVVSTKFKCNNCDKYFDITNDLPTMDKVICGKYKLENFYSFSMKNTVTNEISSLITIESQLDYLKDLCLKNNVEIVGITSISNIEVSND